MENNIQVLIKPASCLCNMKCKYCFYLDEVNHRNNKTAKIMDKTTTFNIINKVMGNSKYSVSFTFQGGEPLLAKIDYYKYFIDTVNKQNINNIKVFYSIQTNGTLINESFAKLFKDNNFLVGISLDGYKELHNKYRENYDLIIDNIKTLEKYNVDYNILQVVTKDMSKNVRKVYLANKKNNFNYLQFIPVLDPINNFKNKEYSLLCNDYKRFLIKMFRYWYNDILKNKRWYCRYFDNLLNLKAGYQVNECILSNSCLKTYNFESNGDCYPCDFYMLDNYFLGNINKDSIENINNNLKKSKFIEDSINTNIKCKTCKYNYLCNGGCQKDKIENKNYYCDAFLGFFKRVFPKYDKLIKLIKKHKI